MSLRGDLAAMDGPATGERRQLFIENISFLSGLSSTVQFVVFIGMIVAALLLLVGCVVCSVRCYQRRRQQKILMVRNPYPNEWNATSASGGATLARRNQGAGNPALASFMKGNMVERQEYDSEDPEDDLPAPNSTLSKKRDSGSTVDSTEPPPPPVLPTGGSAKIRGMNKRVSTRATGNDYGMLNASAKERIASIRMNPELVPIQVKPNSKALKMLGVDETAVERPFDDDIQTRMRRIAEKAGGGSYTSSFGTAALGNQIASGFRDKREKQLEKARARKAMEEEKKRKREEERKAKLAELGQEVDSDEEEEPKKRPEEGMAPGKAKLAAFLSSNSKKVDIDDTI